MFFAVYFCAESKKCYGQPGNYFQENFDWIVLLQKLLEIN